MTEGPLFERGWEVVGIRDAESFFSALGDLLKSPVYLCFEGTSIASNVRHLLEPRAVVPGRQIVPGTRWPKPSTFHVLASEELIQALVALSARHANPEICDHFHAYDAISPLLQWYDAFDDPLLISQCFAESAVRAFCEKLDVRPTPCENL